MNPRDVVIVGACRTAIGKNMGQFKDVQARDLAICAGTEAIKRAGIDPKQCDEIVMGECFLGMQGSLPARQVSMRIGLDETSNEMCIRDSPGIILRCGDGVQAFSEGKPWRRRNSVPPGR